MLGLDLVGVLYCCSAVEIYFVHDSQLGISVPWFSFCILLLKPVAYRSLVNICLQVPGELVAKQVMLGPGPSFHLGIGHELAGWVVHRFTGEN